MDLFKLLGTIEIDNKNANKSLDETSQKGEQAKGRLSKAFTSIGKGAIAVGKTVVTGLAVAGGAFMGLTAKALMAGGELEQNIGGSEAVFKKYARSMQDTAKSAFSDMGLSTSNYLATANKMGALFQGAGFSVEESMKLSSSAMQRAADVASIMGIDTSAAMEAIAGAAKGNFTMMDNLGVAMNDTTLQAYALEKGMKKSTSEMTNQEKIGLAMEMFLERTAYAAGNYAKENETLAGSLSTAKAALANFLDGSGGVDELASSFENFANVAVKNLNELLPRLTSGLTNIVNQIMPMLPPLINTLLPSVIDGATTLINGLVSAFPGVVSALMGVLPALIQGLQDIINSLVAALPQIMQTLVSALPTLIPLLVNALISMIMTLCTMLPQIIQPIIDYLPQIIVSIVNALVQNLPVLIEGLISLVMGIVGALPQIVEGLVGAMPEVISLLVVALVAALPQLIEGAIQLVMGLIAALPQIIQALIDALPEILQAVWDAIVTVFEGLPEWFGQLWEGVKDAVSSAVEAILPVITNVWNAIVSVITTVMAGIRNTVTSVWNGIKSVVTSVVNGIKNTVTSVFNGIKNTAVTVWNGVKTAITTPIEAAKAKVKEVVDAIKGFFSGMKLELPKIKLPHFSISGKLSLDPPSVPKLSIDWYAKAMRNPLLMTTPTIFGYNPATGQPMGGGEAGSEVVSGTGTLMGMIENAVENKTAAQMQTVVSILYAILDAIVNGNAEMLQAILDGHTIRIGEREFARLVKTYA